LIATSIAIRFVSPLSRGFLPGSSAIRPSFLATQSGATGQLAHAGSRTVQTVAPRSMSPACRARSTAREAATRRPPTTFHDLRVCRIAFDSGVTREHAAHIAVENRAPLSRGERRDGGRGGSTDSR
jgi:hypothetical protein